MISLAELPPQRLGMIGLGQIGTTLTRQVVEQIEIEKYPLFLMPANTDAQLLHDTFYRDAVSERIKKLMVEGKQLRPLLLGKSGKGAGGTPELGRQAFQESKDEVERFLKAPGASSLDALIIVAGLGGGTCGAIFDVIDAAAEEQIPTLCIVSMPRMFEGNDRGDRANEMLERLYRTCPTTAIYNQRIPKEMLIRAGWQHVNSMCIMPQLKMLREIIQGVGREMNRDLADWKRVLSKGNYIYLGFSQVPESLDDDGKKRQDKIAEVGKNLIKNPYQNWGIVQKSLDRLYWFKGKRWSFDEQEQIVMSGVSEDSSLKYKGENRLASSEGDDEKEHWVGLLAAAAEPPEEMEGVYRSVSKSVGAPSVQKEAPDTKWEPRESVIMCDVPDKHGMDRELLLPVSIAEIISRIRDYGAANGNGSKTTLTPTEIRAAARCVKERYRMEMGIPSKVQAILAEVPPPQPQEVSS